MRMNFKACVRMFCVNWLRVSRIRPMNWRRGCKPAPSSVDTKHSVYAYACVCVYMCAVMRPRDQRICATIQVRQNKTPQHENRNFSGMREYFCIEFCSFVHHVTAHESVVTGRLPGGQRCRYCFYSRGEVLFFGFLPIAAKLLTGSKNLK